MTLSRIKKVGYILLVVSTLVIVACGKKPVAQPPTPVVTAPPTPPPPAPTITIRAQPASIDRGGSTTLTWEARNAATVTITPAVGEVPLTGNRSVNPTSSVTYQATATGPGGNASDIARVTVNIPAAPPADTPPPRPNVTSGNLDQSLKDVLFDYDKADIRTDMVSVLMTNAAWLKSNPNARLTIEGHCDERGSEEYNIGLGDRRANAVKEFLLTQGVPSSRLNTVSFGEERPACRDETEECFSRNRRAHFDAR
jgi:peptidoglycan-associated lipoprotein